tara:strand:- start:76729 stop:77094 length:366 start_codon:yes stop_codon:yes gene_type:complete
MNDDDVFNPGNIWKRSLEKASDSFDPWTNQRASDHISEALRKQRDKDFKDFLLNGLYKSEDSAGIKRAKEAEERYQRLHRDLKDLLDMCPEAQDAWNKLMGIRRLQGEDEYNDSISKRAGG